MHIFHCLLLQSNTEGGDILLKFVVLIGLLVLIISIGALLFFIIARQKQNKLHLKTKELEELEKLLLKSKVEVQEATLNSIGRELHDNIGQLLSSAKISVAMVQTELQNDSDLLKNAIGQIENALSGIRTISKLFDADWLRQFDLLHNLNFEVARINKTGKLKVHFTQEFSFLPLNPEDQIILFRIIQEGLQNAIKHANASNIYIKIIADEKIMTVTIADDGKGFNMNEKHTDGIGLNNIKVRAKSLGGVAQWNSSDIGTVLKITLSIK